MKTPVAQLVRVSDKDQAREGRAGIDRQIHACKVAAERWDLEIVHEVTLIDVSGDRVADTSEWQQIAQMMRAKTIGGLVIDSTDRLLRESDADLRVVRDIILAKAYVWTPEGRRDLRNRNDRMLFVLLSMLGGGEKESIIRRAQEGKEAKRRRGCWVGPLTWLPQGVAYDRKAAAWSYTDEVKPIVAAFERVSRGESLRSIAISLGRRHNAVRRWLGNPIYNGWLVYDKRRDGDRYESTDGRQAPRRETKRAPQDVIRIRVFDEPAVSDALWDAAQAVLAGNRSIKRRRYNATGDDPFTYRGVLYCGGCDARMVCSPQSNNRHYYECGANRQATARKEPRPCKAGMALVSAVDALVAKAVAEKLARPEVIGRAMAEYAHARETDGRARELTEARARLVRAERGRARLLDQYLTGDWTQAELDARRIPSDREIAEAGALVRRLAAAAPFGGEDVGQLAARFAAAFAGYGAMDQEAKRGVLLPLRPRIYVFRMAKRGLAGVTVPVELRAFHLELPVDGGEDPVPLTLGEVRAYT